MKIRPYLSREEILEMVNSLILLARDNDLPQLEAELLKLEAELKPVKTS